MTLVTTGTLATKYNNLQWLGVALGMAATVLASIWFGADCNFDLRNYHYFNGYSYLYGANDSNLFPAQIQSWLNPHLDACIVWLMRHLSPVMVGVVLAAIQSLYIPCIFLIARYVLRSALADLSPARQTWIHLTVVLIGATSAMTISEIGTTYGDNIACIPVLAGLACLIHCLALTEANAKAPFPFRWIALSGVALGVASGLKLTSLVFIPGFVFGLFWSGGRPIRKAAALTLFAASIFSGWVVLDGTWAWKLWQQTGNPIFPQLGRLFPSPWIGDVDATDYRFSVRTLHAFFAYPFRTAIGDHPGSENFLIDGRYALCFLLLPVALFRRPRGPALAFLVIFFTSMILWMILFGLQRYALPLEMTSGIVIALILGEALPAAPKTVTLSALTLLLVLTTAPPQWGRAPWAYIGASGNWFNVHVPSELNNPNQMFLMLDNADKPQSYIIPFFKTDSVFVRMAGSLAPTPDSFLYQKRRDTIAAHAGPIFSLSDRPPQQDQQLLLASYGLHFNPSTRCILMRTLVDALYLCPLQRDEHASL